MPEIAGGDPEESERLTPRERIDRARSRAWALQIHYRWESEGGKSSFRDVFVDTVANRKVAMARLPHVREITQLLDDHLDDVDVALASALDNWTLDRLSSIDRGVLRIGALELLHRPSVPPRVAIQEAIRLADAYGGGESARFVNGVLDALFKASSHGS